MDKQKLIFFNTPGDTEDGDNVGAYLRASDGTLLTHTTVGAKEALDVNIAGASGQYAEDSAHNSGDIGGFMLAVRADADGSLVDTDGDYAPLQVDADGFLKVAGKITVEAGDAEYLEDSAAADGNAGISVLAVRQDALASSVDTDGDYAWFKTDNRGALWVAPVGNVADDAVDSENPIKVGSRALAGPLTAVASGDRADMISDLYRRVYVNTSANIGIQNQDVDVTDTAATLVASALGGRRTLLVQHLGNKAIYLGKDATVTAANGFKLEAGAVFSIDLGPNVSLFAIGSVAAAQDIRILEIA